MTRVAILHFAGPPVVGGVESTIYHHARLLTEAGYRVKVLAGRGGYFYPGVDFHRIPGIDSRDPQVLSVGNELAQGNVTESFNVLRDALVQSLKPILENVDVCIVHNAITLHKNLALTAALHRLSEEGVVPLIAWSHDFAWLDNLYTGDLHDGYPWDLLRRVWPGVRYVVVSEHRRDRLSELLGLPAERIQVVTPGVDLDEFLGLQPLTRKLSRSLDLPGGDPLMLLPARITRRKNIEFAIRITGALQPRKPNAVLVITGPPGPHNPKNIAYLQALKELKAELNLSGKVHFLYEQGEENEPLHIPDEVMADLYRLSDLLLFPSRREGFGIPVLEAGLARMPVFAADIPPVRESAGEWAHRFDPEGDPAEVAADILAALEKDAGYQLRKRVIGRFTWQAILHNRIIPLIEATIAS